MEFVSAEFTVTTGNHINDGYLQTIYNQLFQGYLRVYKTCPRFAMEYNMLDNSVGVACVIAKSSETRKGKI